MSARTILITGGAGFIGSHAVRRFVTRYPQYRIINLDALTYAGNLENLRDVEGAANYTFVKADIRNSKVIDVVRELTSFSCQVDVTDPHADSDEVKHEYGYELAKEVKGPYDAIIVAVNHTEYANKDEAWFKDMLTAKGILVDLKGIYRKKVKSVNYWSL